MRITDTHIYFYKSWMSNWTPNNLEIIYKDLLFTNSEQLFMWFKADYFKDYSTRDKIAVLGFSPRTAKELGREVKNYNDDKWKEVRENYMYLACLAKFESSEDLKNKLLATDNKVLVEASPIDRIWGIGLAEYDDKVLDENQWLGLNLLGKTLMKVRNELKNK